MHDSHHHVEDEFTANPLVAFLDCVERLPDTTRRRQRTYELLQIKKGLHIVDVGCGAGTAAFEIDALVGPGGSVVGIDINEGLLTAARTRAERRNLQCTFQLEDAAALPFADGSIHGYRAERLYQHLRGPEKYLKEAYRVLAPKGRIVLVDQDWDGVLVDADDLATTRVIARAVSTGSANSAVGRQYYRLLKDAGFVDVEVFADTHVSTSFQEYGFFIELWTQIADATGIVPANEAQAWLEEQRNRAANGRFFMAMTHFIAVAQR